jgi:predicted DNA-binding transcriptional regulator YafY
VRLTDEPAQRPPRFQLRRWIDEQRGMDLPTGEVARVVLEVDAMTARHLEESALARDQRVQWLDAEHARVEATLPITEQLLWWLLGHGRRVRVVSPASLRRRWLDAGLSPLTLPGPSPLPLSRKRERGSSRRGKG